MPRLFTPEIAAFYEEYYKAKGVNIIKGTTVTAFEKDDQGNVSLPTFFRVKSFKQHRLIFTLELMLQVTKVILADGRTLSTNLVVVGIGGRPVLGPFKGQLEEEKGGFKVKTSHMMSQSDFPWPQSDFCS